MITANLSTLKIHKLTQEQYDRELAAGNIDETALYLTPDEEIDLSGYATTEQLADKVDKSDLVQSDWNQTDESAVDFIKNKPDESDALALLAEVGFVEPVADADGSIYTDENGNIYTLI